MKIEVMVDSKAVKAALSRLNPLVVGNVKDAVKKSAFAVVNESKRACPVDQGLLRGSLTTKEYQDWLSADVGTNVEYAPYIEHGTGVYAKGGGGRQTPWVWKSDSVKWRGWHYTRGSKPQPFLFPSWEQEKPEYLNRLRTALKNAVDKAGG